MQDNLDRASQSFSAKAPANFRLEIGRLTMHPQKAGKVLQAQESLLMRAQQAEAQPEAVEVGGPGVVHSRQIMHGYDRIMPDTLLVMTQILNRLFLAEDINRVLSLQLADQCEIFLQDFVRR